MKTPKNPVLLCLLIFQITSCRLDNLHEEVEFKPVEAAFKASITICIAPCEVSFTNQSQNAISYYWGFGNVDTSMQARPSIEFTSPGDNSITLRANGSDCPAMIIKTVSISACPVLADFSIQNDNYWAPCTVDFANQSFNASFYEWDV